MSFSQLNADILTNIAITALKNAYGGCSDTSAKESIITAFKAVIQLRHNLGKNGPNDMTSENDGDFDPSEYCAAV